MTCTLVHAFHTKEKPVNRRTWYGAAIALSGLLLVSCAATQVPVEAGADTPGFWLGLWHGCIAPIAFVIGLFNDVRIYAVPNTGGWYDLGFLIGISCWGGGGCTAASRRKRD